MSLNNRLTLIEKTATKTATRVATPVKHGDISGHNRCPRSLVKWGSEPLGVPMIVTYKEGVTGSSPVAPTPRNKPLESLHLPGLHDRSPR
jgi:hypothetical protein